MLTKQEEQSIENKKESLTGCTFRLSKETIDEFRNIAKDLGENQEYALSVLINSYKGILEKNQLKNPDRFDEFEKYLSVLKDLYLNSLRATDDATLLAKQEYAAQLVSKDNIIIELQEKANKAEEEKEKALKELSPVKEELAQVVLTLSDAKNEIGSLTEQKNALQSSYEDKIQKLEKELEEARFDDRNTRSLYEENVKTVVKLEGEIDTLKKQEGPIKENLSKVTSENKVLLTRVEYLEKENESLHQDLEALKLSKEAEIELARKQAALETKDSMLTEIENARNEANEIRLKYLELLEQQANKKSK